MISLKPNCRIKTLPRGLVLILYGLYKFVRSRPDLCPAEVVITSINDSGHSKNSRHYKDEAVDLRSKNFAPSKKEPFRVALGVYLNTLCSDCQFTVLLEDLGTDNEHFHIQVRKWTKCT